MCIKFVYTPENDYLNENNGYDKDGNKIPYCNTVFNPTDYPLFRLADTYLMLAECELNGAQNCNGLEMMNRVHSHRRSDLIRFGKFAGSDYNWSWKGGNAAGANVSAHRNLYCIPKQFVSTLGQNPGYSN